MIPNHKFAVNTRNTQFPDYERNRHSNTKVNNRQTIDLLTHLWRGGAWGNFWTPDGGADGDKKLSLFIPTNSLKLPSHWLTCKNTYFGVNPAIKRRDGWQRSINAEIAAINCLFAEFDGKDETNPSEEQIRAHYDLLMAGGAKSAKAAMREAIGLARKDVYKTDPATYKAMALERIEGLSVRPSVTVASGGGYQCYWLLDEPLVFADENERQRAADIQARWVGLVGGDPGAKDLARVLRLPGGINFKKAYAPHYPTVEFVWCEFDRLYTFAELTAQLPTVAPAPKRKAGRQRNVTVAKPQRYDSLPSSPTPAATVEKDRYTLLDEFNLTTDHAALLREYGYTDGGAGRMIRPGGASASVELRGNRSRHWSSNDGLYNERWQTPFNAYREYTHNGNQNDALKALRRAHLARLAEGRQIAHKIRNLVDARVFDALIDLAEKQGAGIIRAPYRVLVEKSGVALRSISESMGRLVAAGHISKRMQSTGEIHWVLSFATLARMAGLFSPCSKVENPVYTTGKTLFSEMKANDAFNRGGSRRAVYAAMAYSFGADFVYVYQELIACENMRQRWLEEADNIDAPTLAGSVAVAWSVAATDPAVYEKLDMLGLIVTFGDGAGAYYTLAADWREAARAIRPTSVGPGALRVISTLDTYGDCTYDEIAEYNDFTYKSTARYVLDAFKSGAVTKSTDECGRVTVSLCDDWKTEIMRQLPAMPTYQLQRSRAIRHCQERLIWIEKQIAADPTQKAPLEKMRERTYGRLAGLMAPEGANTEDSDFIINQMHPASIQATINTTTNSRRRALMQIAANHDRFNRWATEDATAKGFFTPAQDRHMEQMRQLLEDNSLYIDLIRSGEFIEVEQPNGAKRLMPAASAEQQTALF